MHQEKQNTEIMKMNLIYSWNIRLKFVMDDEDYAPRCQC